MATFDLAVGKRFPMGGARSLQLRLEAFNLFNRANFANPSNIIVFDQNGRVPSAGRITSTVTSARQMQIGAKFTF
jgi:hypothetical protein